jgi:hypothetical protein
MPSRPRTYRKKALNRLKPAFMLYYNAGTRQLVVFGEKPTQKTNHKVFVLKRTISRMKHLRESQEIGTEDVEKLKKVRSHQNRTPI